MWRTALNLILSGTTSTPSNGQTPTRKLSKMKKVFDKVICLGCGWIGNIAELSGHGACPECKYENGVSLWRLLTLREMLDSDEETGYMNVRLDLFLASLFRLLGLELNGETNDDHPN